ncbi:MAG: DUF3795 domain-containing protein [Candidatus Cloacimonetes bacterium]|nr:DUF3795 domain-containing protein [Candidatus Cloacimonadota bacterium]
MNKNIAYCGLDCNQCDAYKATMNDDDELRNKLAEFWSKNSGMEIDPMDISCTGCKSDGVQIGYCAECAIRHCGIKKGLENCAYCPNYSCEILDTFIGDMPTNKARENLEEIRR